MSSVQKTHLPGVNGTPLNGRSVGPTPSVDPVTAREIDLFSRAQAGDRGAFGQLAIACQDRLYNAIVRLVGDRDEARELAQETFVKALDKIDTFRGDSKPYTWLFRIGLNLALSHLRQVKRQRTFSLDRPAPARGRHDQAAGLADRLSSAGDAPEAAMELREQAQQVMTALGTLDAEYRAILVMRDIEDMDYQLMADTLGLPLGTLKSRLFRARRALREALLIMMKD